MKEINTVMEPFVWNYTQPKGTTFSRLLLIDADLTGAVYDFEIVGTKGTVKPKVEIISIVNNITTLKVSLTPYQTSVMSLQNKWYFKITYKTEAFVCWVGTFNLREYI